jgi:hypothetical protein
MSAVLLESFAKAAEEAGFRAWVVPAGGAQAVSELFCLIHVDQPGRNYVVHGMFPDELTAAFGAERSPDDIAFLQLTLALPFTVEEAASTETALLLHSLNLLTPIGQFILSDDEGLIVFRSMLPHGERDLPVALVVEAIRMTRFFVTEFLSIIEPVAQGLKTCRDTLDELARRGVSLPTVAAVRRV